MSLLCKFAFRTTWTSTIPRTLKVRRPLQRKLLLRLLRNHWLMLSRKKLIWMRWWVPVLTFILKIIKVLITIKITWTISKWSLLWSLINWEYLWILCQLKKRRSLPKISMYNRRRKIKKTLACIAILNRADLRTKFPKDSRDLCKV